jgi:hypothetical protein
MIVSWVRNEKAKARGARSTTAAPTNANFPFILLPFLRAV